MIKLYDYQKKAIEEINKNFKDKNRVLLQLPTGAGKTFVFSFFVKEWIKKHLNAKVLILVHREELLEQSARSLRNIGVTVETVVASKKTLNHLSSSYVAMIETAVNRLKKDPHFFKDITLVIADECHLLLFERVFNYFEGTKILGVTATPASYKKINFSKCARCGKVSDKIEDCCNIEMFEYVRNFTFSEIYDEIISPVQVQELIDLGSLVKEVNYSAGSIQRDNLKIDAKTGDFDSKSSDEEFSKKGSVLDVVLNYENICKDKKTLIFNNSTATNLLVYNQFLEKGYENVKMLDSVNKCENRKQTLKWFKDTPNAILMNCGFLTAGFDEDTIESIIMNRATTSLMLYIQIAGRGARTTTRIFKDRFTFIDLGGNIEVHGRFSDYIDWTEKFYGTDAKPKPKKEALEQVKECSECGLIHAKNLIECPECGFFQKQKETLVLVSGEIAKLVDSIPLPDGIKIVKYCERIGKDKNFAWSVLQSQILDLFYYHNVTEGTFIKTVDNGKFEMSIRNIIKSPYAIIQGSTLDGGVMRTKAWVVNKIKKKLNEYYEKKGRK